MKTAYQQNTPLAKRPLSIYNMWPRSYVEHPEGAFAAMADDLDRVREMNFNTVYVNPFGEVGKFPKADQGLTGSLYATSDLAKSNPALFVGENEPFFDENGQITEVGQQVKTFCDTAYDKGLTPMFDLVQSHLAPGSPHIAKAREKGIEILKVHKKTGKAKVHGLDENHNRTAEPHEIWDDVVYFNFDDPTAKDYILNEILIPHAKEMAHLGFRGCRIDSSPNTPREIHEAVVGAFKDELKKNHKTQYQDPPVLAETLAYPKPNVEQAKVTKDIATHYYSSSLWVPDPKQKRKDKNANTLFDAALVNRGKHFLKDELWQKAHGGNGAVIMPVSTHDEKRLYKQLEDLFSEEFNEQDEAYENAKRALRSSITGRVLKDADTDRAQILDQQNQAEKAEMIARWARIKIVWSAMFSSGGYMMISGDEYLNQEKQEHTPAKFDGTVVDSKTAESILKQTGERTLNTTFEYEGEHYELRKGYQHPFHQYDSIPEHEETVLLKLAPLNQMKDLAQDTAKDPQRENHDLTAFIGQVNKAMAKRKDINIDFYPDVYFSEKDPDYMCVISHTGAEGLKKKQHKLHEVHVIDISGKKREKAVVPEAVIDEFIDKAVAKDSHYKKAGFLQKFKDNMQLVGDFPEPQKSLRVG